MQRFTAILLCFSGILVTSACWPSTAIGGTTLALESVATLPGETPVFVTHAPGDFDRVYVVLKGGTVRVIDNGVLSATPFLDIGTSVFDSGEAGLLGLAFHPDYPDTSFIYVYYIDTNVDTVISRFNVLSPTDADEASETLLLTFDQVGSNHNGGWMGFSPADGFLYVSTGDGGGGCDPQDTGQDLTRFLGKMLRIDVDSGSPYAVPPDNPFVGVAGLDEIWAYGLRNPWRCAFDRELGDLYIADVGQLAVEEIDYQAADSSGGENYGWDCREGSECAEVASGCPTPSCDCTDVSLIDPIHEYFHESGRCSITGGEVYRGCAIPDLSGRYFFGDWCSGEIWSLRMENGVKVDVQEHGISATPFSLNAFGRDAYGEIYVCSSTDGILKIVPENPVITDCDGSGEEDACEIADGTAPDANDNGEIDTCEAGPPIPACSEWGLAVMIMLIGVTATLAFVRPRMVPS